MTYKTANLRLRVRYYFNKLTVIIPYDIIISLINNYFYNLSFY